MKLWKEQEKHDFKLECGQCHGELEIGMRPVMIPKADILLLPGSHTKMPCTSSTEIPAPSSHTALYGQQGKGCHIMLEQCGSPSHQATAKPQGWCNIQVIEIADTHTSGQVDFLYYNNIFSKIYTSVVLLG